MLPYFFVGRTTEQQIAERDQLENVVVEAADLTGIFAVLGVPQTDFFVPTGGVNPFAIVAEGDSEDRSLMAGVSRFQIARSGVVNPRCSVAAGRRQMRAVTAPGNCHDPIGVLLNEPLLLAAGHDVKTNRIVRAANREQRAVRTE